MYTYEYSDKTNVGRICFELSPKPFKKLTDEYIEGVCRKLYTQWMPLIRRADGLAIMMWTSDGSEILDYDGDLSGELEWARYIGIGNPRIVRRVPGTTWDDERSLHVEPVLYMKDPPRMTYADLRRIILALKTIGKEMTGFDVQVGETFDPGPEFAYSSFKFERHTEMNKGLDEMNDGWLHCAGHLHADDRHYAAYPNGIPEDTVFGEFLAKQFMALKKDVGFDYLWLSNGFGFSLSSWQWTGELFDGKVFSTGAEEVRRSIREFWDNYTPYTDFITEVRGSNLSTAMDIAAHGCPIDYIYKNPIIAPPNSPWAALDSRFGLELVGYLSHMAEVPEAGYAFRYYVHDPWWINCPWFDRYGRSPHDIYLPLAVTRMKEDGTTQKPHGLNFLSADDSFGNLPDRCPNEVIPHLLEGYRTYPDAPGFLTWLYPFDDYCRMGLREGKNDRMMMDDWFIEGAIDGGLPLNTVVSDKTFLQSPVEPYRHTILLCPVPEEGGKLDACVKKALDAGIPVLLYGPTDHASAELRALIGVKNGEGIDGELTLDTSLCRDVYECGTVSKKLIHESLISNGPVTELSDGTTEVLAGVTDAKGTSRVYAAYNAGKKLGWLRGSFPHMNNPNTYLPPLYDLREHYNPSYLLRGMLASFGLTISFNAYSTGDKLPLVLTSAFENGYYFTAFCKDETIETHLSAPLGAPAILNTTFMLENDTASYRLPKSLHEECRVFIRQKERSKVTCRIETVGDNMYDDRRISLCGLKDAVVTVLAPMNTRVNFYTGNYNGGQSDRCWGESTLGHHTDENGYQVSVPVTGDINITWQDNDTYRKYVEDGQILEERG